MLSFWQVIFLIAAWVVYYFLLKIFNFNKKLDKYIEEVKRNGNYDKSCIESYKKYLNVKCIVSTLIFVSVTVVIFIFEFLNTHMWMVELIAILAVGKLTEVIGNKFIQKKFPFEI